MGQFTLQSQMSGELFNTMRVWLGRLRGGLAMAAIAGCAAFAATSGSSMATTATMAVASLPHMKKYNYASSLATGSIASGGTLGILIPPSIGFIIYGIVTEESIGKLFIAGIFPGILLTALFILTILIITKFNNELGPPGPSTSLKEKVLSIKNVWPVVVLSCLVIGGLYGGVFTSTEAGAIGATGALIIGLVKRRLSFRGIRDSILETGSLSAMIFIIIIGAMIFSTFLAASTIPGKLAASVASLSVPPIFILLAILLFYIILGTFMDINSGLLLTLPVTFPLIIKLGYDPIWFGVISVLILEIGLVTPPVGLNVFVMKGVAPDVPIITIYRGIIPFFLAMLVCLALLILIPKIATFLPSVMYTY
jgi:tripartite ATP-independent transporter DctM subunit